MSDLDKVESDWVAQAARKQRIGAIYEAVTAWVGCLFWIGVSGALFVAAVWAALRVLQ